MKTSLMLSVKNNSTNLKDTTVSNRDIKDEDNDDISQLRSTDLKIYLRLSLVKSM